jgi:hypothetical protein
MPRISGRSASAIPGRSATRGPYQQERVVGRDRVARLVEHDQVERCDPAVAAERGDDIDLAARDRLVR